MENLEESWNFKMVISRPGKVMEICYIHMFISVEFKIIHMFLKGRRSKKISQVQTGGFAHKV